jgi:hypothetical protein
MAQLSTALTPRQTAAAAAEATSNDGWSKANIDEMGGLGVGIIGSCHRTWAPQGSQRLAKGG